MWSPVRVALSLGLSGGVLSQGPCTPSAQPPTQVPKPPSIVSPAPASPTTQDCADAAMETLHQAPLFRPPVLRPCLGGSLVNMSDDDLVDYLDEVSGGKDIKPTQHVRRVATYSAPNGGKLVFYAADSGRPDERSTGYVIYLDDQGRVRRID